MKYPNSNGLVSVSLFPCLDLFAVYLCAYLDSPHLSDILNLFTRHFTSALIILELTPLPKQDHRSLVSQARHRPCHTQPKQDHRPCHTQPKQDQTLLYSAKAQDHRPCHTQRAGPLKLSSKVRQILHASSIALPT